MKKHHLSTYISLTITFLVIASTLLISGILYFNLSKRLTGEFEDRVAAESGEAEQVLVNQFNRARNRLREVSLDNTIRVTMMLGAYQQLQDHFCKKFGGEENLRFFIKPLQSDRLFFASGQNLSSKKILSLLASPDRNGEILHTERFGFIAGFVRPVFRQKDRIGTAGCIYILKNDEKILRAIARNKESTIILEENKKAWDLLSGKPISSFDMPGRKKKTAPPFHGTLNGEKIAGVQLTQFPDLLYISNLGRLGTGKQKVFTLVLYTSLAVLLVTIGISFFLSRLLVQPLSRLSKQSLEMADNTADFSRQAVSSKVIEVDQLMTSLAAMVKGMRRAEELKRYQELFEAVTDPVIIYDFSGRLLKFNEIAANQLGLDRESCSQLRIFDLVPEKNQEKMVNSLEDLARTRGPRIFETEIVTRNEAPFFAEFHARTIPFKDQEVVLSVVRDITDRKTAAEALIHSEERLTLALEVSMASAWELNLKTSAFTIDSNLMTAAGYQESDTPETLGQVLKLIPQESRKKVKASFTDFIKGKQKDYRDDFSVKTANNERRWIHNRARIVSFDDDNTPLVVIGTAIDITEQKKAEQTLRENEERYRTILENRNMGYFELDLYGNLTFFNNAICSILGYPPEEVSGMSYKAYTDEKTAAQLKQAYQNLLATEEVLENFQYNLTGKDGKIKIVETSVFLRRNVSGEAVGFRGLISDITRNVQTENEKKRLEVELRQTHKMEAIGTLAGGIAHDFNNILSGIFGYSQLAEKNIDTPLKAKQHIALVRQGAQRAAELIQQILTFSRQAEHEKQLLNISIVVKEALKLIRSTLPSTIGIEEKIVSPAYVMADATQIHQVIMNLCTNAYHAMGAAGGTLTAELHETEIEDKKSAPDPSMIGGRYLVLTISDTGEGMTKETLAKVFDPYFTTKSVKEGTGLGLSLVYGIVDDHEGYVKAESTPGRGSTFKIFLPAGSGGKKESTTGGKEPSPPVRGNESLLIVDDEPSILSSTKELLEDYGYRVTALSNGKEALQAFKKAPSQFDLMITDMTMPQMAGDQLAAESLKIRNDLPVLLCSGYSDTMSEARARGIGIRRFLQKPLAGDTLLTIIREVLDEGA
ncbi:MAG: PAS domain S-box protein [Desulfobacteraceae bacterium]